MSNGSAGIGNVKGDGGKDAIQLRQWWTSAKAAWAQCSATPKSHSTPPAQSDSPP